MILRRDRAESYKTHKKMMTVVPEYIWSFQEPDDVHVNNAGGL